MIDTYCWDCFMFCVQFGVRCARHRTFGEKEKLEAQMREVQERLSRPILWSKVTKAPREDRPADFQWVKPLKPDE